MPPGAIVPFHCRSSHCGANTPCEVPTWKTGSLTGAEPRLPTVTTSVREGGAPNQVRMPLLPSSRGAVRTLRRPVPDCSGIGATGWPPIFNSASTTACSSVTVATCTTQGQGFGGAATGSGLLKAPLASVVTARPSALAQELVPPITPWPGVDWPQTSSIRSVPGRQPVPLAVISVPLAASGSESVTTGFVSSAAAGGAHTDRSISRTAATSAAPLVRGFTMLLPSSPTRLRGR